MHYFVIPALIAIIYIFVVRPKIKQYRAVSGIIEKADAKGAPIWEKFLARLSGLKTVILGSLAALMPQLPPVMDEINGFTGWHVLLDSGVADKIAAVLAAATAVTHVYGLVSAAKTIPVGIVEARIVPGAIVPPALQATAEKAAATQSSGGA
ncbi:MAG: hypothetical protein M3178_01385 [Pseudomonadota bacterium]|nr:hypothetical protein [Pseudomonadota bacterium]